MKTVTRQIKDKTQPIRALRMAKAAEGVANNTSETSMAHSVSQSSIPQQSQEQSSQPPPQVIIRTKKIHSLPFFGFCIIYKMQLLEICVGEVLKNLRLRRYFEIIDYMYLNFHKTCM